MCLLQKVRQHVQTNINKRTPVSPYIIEFVSALERVYNFGHTGSSKALSRQLMDRFWMSLGITNDGFPSLHPSLNDITDPSQYSVISVTKALEYVWACKPVDNKPLFASKRAQVLTYGTHHWTVRLHFIYLSRILKIISDLLFQF